MNLNWNILKNRVVDGVSLGLSTAGGFIVATLLLRTITSIIL